MRCKERITALLLTHAGEALAAVNGTVGLGLKRNPGLTAAGSAGSGEILTGAAGRSLAGVAAGLAALGLVLETALRVELLLTAVNTNSLPHSLYTKVLSSYMILTLSLKRKIYAISRC